MDSLLTTDEVAGRLKVDRKTVQRWIQAGRLHAQRAGRNYRVTESALSDFLKGEERRPALTSRPVITAVANQKGGAGKTTTTLNLGVALAQLGRRVLLVDSDPQGGLTASAGIGLESIHLDLYGLLSNEDAAPDGAIIATTFGVDVIPATIDLSGAELELSNQMSREFVLKRLLLRVGTYDHILIDCPPSLSLLTINALAAAHRVLIPVECSYLATRGISQLWRSIRLVREKLNPDLHVLGILPTRYDGRNRHSEETVASIREQLPQYILPIVVKESVRAKEAARAGLPLLQYEPTSELSEAYRRLAQEVDHA